MKMNQWMKMSEWKWMNEWMNEWMTEWLKESINQSINQSIKCKFVECTTTKIHRQIERDQYFWLRNIHKRSSLEGDQSFLAESVSLWNWGMCEKKKCWSLVRVFGCQGDLATFEVLAQAFHNGQILGLDVCMRKPLIATCSLDRSVRIWNNESWWALGVAGAEGGVK